MIRRVSARPKAGRTIDDMQELSLSPDSDYADSDVWCNYGLDSPLHAAETRNTEHHSLASRMRRLPFRLGDDSSRTRRRADLMLLVVV
jgi:hypothetical protein